MSSTSYQLTSKDKQVVISFTFFNTDTAKTKFIGRWIYNEDNHQRIVNGMLDSTTAHGRIYGKEYGILDSNKVTLFKGEELKKYGADDAGIANIPVIYPYKKIYKKIKLFYMYKRGHGEVYLTYYYNDDAVIKKCLAETKYMLTYKN